MYIIANINIRCTSSVVNVKGRHIDMGWTIEKWDDMWKY